MAQYLALTSKGLRDVLWEELLALGAAKLKEQDHNVLFEMPWKDIPELHARSRVATRFLKPLAEFQAYNDEEFYNSLIKKIDFKKFFTKGTTFRIDAHVTAHRELRDQRYVALRMKDIIRDQLRDEDLSPDIDKENPDIVFVVRVKGINISIALDLTGDSLSHRGYRTQAGDAPLRENLAAGLVLMAGWDKKSPIVDPFCGAGTILIEAARMMLDLPVSVQKKDFLYEKLQHVYGDFVDLKKHVERSQPKMTRSSSSGVLVRKKSSSVMFYGFDEDPQVIKMAKMGAERAGVADMIDFQIGDARNLKNPAGPTGWVITNPPYGVRMSTENLGEVYKKLGERLKKEFVGWQCYLLSGEPELTRHLGLKAERKFVVRNSELDCRFLHYPITARTPKAAVAAKIEEAEEE